MTERLGNRRSVKFVRGVDRSVLKPKEVFNAQSNSDSNRVVWRGSGSRHFTCVGSCTGVRASKGVVSKGGVHDGDQPNILSN